MNLLKNKYLIAILTVFLTINSCKESNLDIRPLSPTEASYFKEEIEFERAVYAVYAGMTDIYAWNGGLNGWEGGEGGNNPNFGLWLLPGDDITSEGSGSDNINFETFTQLTPSNGPLNRYYTATYNVIGMANTLLQKLQEEESVYQTANLKNYHTGEALFLRGLMHFNLWNYYGTSPVLIKRIQDLGEVLASPSQGTQLLDQAIADFTEAANLLPLSWDANNRGRATANSANGMLGKALVYRGTVNKNTQDFTAAIAAIDKITGASLTEKFDDNFAFDTENNAESLFEWQASEPFGGDNLWLTNDFDNAIGQMSTSSWVPFRDVNNWAYGGKPFVATNKLETMYEAGDPRLELTLDPENNNIRKYITRDQETIGGSSVNNPRILRYADALLLKAEAILQSGGAVADAINLINQVRTRARNTPETGGLAPTDRDVAVTDKNTVMQWIMDERLMELAGEEGIRWMDLRRWHMGGIIQLSTEFFNSQNANIAFDPAKHLYFPIPLDEMDRNFNMKQNPGY